VGYTTTFEGRFDVYRPEGPLMAEFLRAIYAGDEAARRAFIDWLQEQGDPRGEQAAREPAKLLKLFGLRPEHAAYLRQFGDTRRMKRDAALLEGVADPVREAVGVPVGVEGAWFVGSDEYFGPGAHPSILDPNRPPKGQPGLYCQWVPSEDGTAIEWDGVEKFYDYVPWLRYVLQHFLIPWGYVVNGRMEWQGEDPSDEGTIHVRENQIEVKGSRRGR
jgi:uncharacterized protein (TIGR02996 family)